MATTYDRLYVVLREIDNYQENNNLFEIVPFINALIEKRISELTIQREDPNSGEITAHPLSVNTIEKYISLLNSFRFINQVENQISISNRGSTSLDQERYPLAIAEATYEYLESLGLPRSKLYQIIDSTETKELPTSDVIYDSLDDNVNKAVLNVELFRRLMYMLACSESLNREVIVYYAR